MLDPIIRPYEEKDREAVRKIAWETAFMGEPASIFFDGRELVSDLLTACFLDYEPLSCFVAEEEGAVAGYIIGSIDVKKSARIFVSRVFPGLIFKSILRGTFLSKKNLNFTFRFILSFLKGEFASPGFSNYYPATLHINLKPGARRKGLGSKLMRAYLDYLSRKRVFGVHMTAMSERGIAFFRKEGFEVLYQNQRSYFRHILGKSITAYVFGKRLSE